MVKNENIEITRILDIMKSKKLVILFILIIFTLLGYIYSYHYLVPKYKSTSTLLLIPNSTSEGSVRMTSDLAVNADLTVNSGLIETYRRIGENSKVLKQVINNLELDMTEEELLKEMKITVMKDTYVIQVAVTDTDPQKAMKIAQQFDEVFLQEIKEIYHLDNIGIVDEAQVPEKPYNINHLKDMLLFFSMGIGVSLVSIIVFYLFDNTIKKEEEIEKYIQLKSLGSIPMSQDKTQEIVSRENAKSYVTECINTIRTNILYMNSAKNAKTILITSCTPREGKSWVSANIATAFAETDKKVLLIDADMRKGRAHKIFKVMNTEGLSNYLYEMTGDKKEDILLGKKYIKETPMPNLHILTNGNIPPNPSELLESQQMKELLEILKSVYDIIIMDAPPCKLVTDSIILSTIVDSTILVANAEKTKMNEFNEVKKSIQMVDGEIIGAILNKKKVAGKLYSKGYYYGHADQNKVEEVETKEIIPVDEMMKQAILKVEEKGFEDEREDSKETKGKEENSEKEDSNYEDMKIFMSKKLKELQNNYVELANEVKDKTYLEALLRRLEEQKLTKEQIETVIKNEMLNLEQERITKEQIEKVMKEEIANLNEDKLTKEQVKKVIKEEITNLNQDKLTKEQVEKVMKEEIANSNQDKLTKEQVEKVIKEEIANLNQDKLTKEQIEKVIKEEIANLNQDKLTKEQVEKVMKEEIANASQDKLTKQQVENIVKQEIENIYNQIKEVKNDYYQLADDIKDTSYIEFLVERIEEEKVTKQQIENVIKKEISIMKQKELSKEEIENMIKQELSTINQQHKSNTQEIIKEVVKDNIEKLLETIHKEKKEEQQIQLLVSQKITEMQEETQKLLEQEITKIDYTDQILQMNEMLTSLKDSYLELSNKMRIKEGELQATLSEEEQQLPSKSKNIIDFKAFKKQKNKKRVYSIEEDISYEDLEETAAFVIPLQMKKTTAEDSVESYQKTMW